MDEIAKYYYDKDQAKRLLRDALTLITEIRKHDPVGLYDKVESILKSRLEMAEYVGD